MIKLKKYNKGYQYLLTCIDVLSKRAWVEPTKDKSCPEITRAFKSILDSSDQAPAKVWTDRGKEFLNRHFQQLLKSRNIKHYTCNNPETKCSIVERFNRTIKTKIWKYFTNLPEWDNFKYIDVLPDLVDSYNNSYHKTIQMSPNEVNKQNEAFVRNRLLASGLPSPKLKLGDTVRVSKVKGIFEKGYLPNWSEEVFKIDKVKNNMYKIKDICDGEVLEGLFYAEELQKIEDTGEYLVEQVLKTRKRGGIKEAFVKWVGYPSKCNQWIPEKDIKDMVQEAIKLLWMTFTYFFPVTLGNPAILCTLSVIIFQCEERW
jgi:hypothetical protein